MMNEAPNTQRRNTAPAALVDLIESGHVSLGDALIANRITRICGEPLESDASLALTLTLRALRDGSTALDLRRAYETLPEQRDDAELDASEAQASDSVPKLVDLRALPNSAEWLAEIVRSPLVAQGVLRVDLGLVYLDRYHADETLIASRLLDRDASTPPPLGSTHSQETPPGADLEIDFNGEQGRAIESVLHRSTTVLTGGPGMGKTHTIGGVLRAIRAASGPDFRVALAAPTGKAAARMSESLAEQGIELDAPATTLHRLLGPIPGVSQRFRHNERNPLPQDLVIVDEASMISLSMMARLLEALPLRTRLLLVGDPDQLASVEAGSVLRDVAEGLGEERGVIQLVQEFRLASARAELARAFRRGDADAVVNLVASNRPAAQLEASAELQFIETDTPAISDIPGALGHATHLREAALSGDRTEAVTALSTSRLLCAHRSGPYGTSRWNRIIEQALAERWPDIAHQEMYVGRPLMVRRNDFGLGVTNGDTGVVMRDQEKLTVAFTDDVTQRANLSPWRLSDIETMHAMTIHKAQGSQADHVTVIVPPLGSRLLTREMLYTAVTRARTSLRIVGSLEAVRVAVNTPAERSSGLALRLRGAAQAAP